MPFESIHGIVNRLSFLVATYNKYAELGWGIERILQLLGSNGGAFIAKEPALNLDYNIHTQNCYLTSTTNATFNISNTS